MNVGLVSNTFDYDDDVKSRKRTFPVRFGQPNAVKLLNIATGIAFAVIIASAAFQLISYFSLVVVLLSVLAFRVLNDTRRFTELNRYTRAMGSAIALSALSGIMLTLGYLGEVLLLN